MSFAIPMIAYICLLLYTLMYIRPRTQSLMVFPWMIIAVLITLPTWSPTPIGHEAIYASIYNGEDWEQGSTLAYPAMQLWSAFWGFLLYQQKWGIILSSVLVAALSLALFFHILRKKDIPQIYAIIGVLCLLIHPEFSSWMGHMHNIIVPLFFAIWAQWILLSDHKRGMFFAPITISVAIMMRLEFIILIPFFAIQVPRSQLWKSMLVGGVLCGLSIPPLLHEIPGEGERLLSFLINLPILDFWTPTLWVLLPLLLFTKNKKSIAVGVFVLLIHLCSSTFNDYGPRHLTPTIPIIIWVLCDRKTAIPITIAILFILWGRWERTLIYEASEEDFTRYIEEKHPQLPRLSLSQARTEQCAWIVEEAAFVDDNTPIRSHFNLYQKEEAQALQKEHKCIHWCLTKEDWRWSTLSVQARAVRLRSLYATEPVAIIQEQESSCILHRVGSRIH
jgi:hypothetical protein